MSEFPDTSLLETNVVFLDRDDLVAVRLQGSDAKDWLHRISSQDVRSLEARTERPNLLLNDSGRVLATFDTVEDGGSYRLWTSREQSDRLLERLEFYHFSEDVSWEPLEERRRVLVLGREADALLEKVLRHPTESRGFLAGEVQAARERHLGVPAWNLDVDAGHGASLHADLEEAGVRSVPLSFLDVLRIESGLARWPDDLEDGVFPHEARLERAFDLDKGCYPGQETVARMDTYGGPQRKLFGFVLEGKAVIRKGEVHLDDAPVGTLTSGTFSHRMGHPIALGYLKKRAWKPGSTVTVTTSTGSVMARIAELPFVL